MAAFLAGRLPFLGIAGVVEETLAAVDGAPAGDLEELVEADGEARRLAERSRRSAGAVNIFVAILGLEPARPRPRGGPLLHRARRRHEPAAVLHRLPAGDRPRQAQGHRVRDRGDPARRLREDPGDAPARRRRTWTRSSGRRSRRRRSCVAPIERVKRKLDEGDMEGARDQLPALDRGARRHVESAGMAQAQRGQGAERARRTGSASTRTGASGPGRRCWSSSRARGRTCSSRSSSSRRSSWSAAAATGSASRWRRTRRSCTTCGRIIPPRRSASQPGDRILSDQRPEGPGRVDRSRTLIQQSKGGPVTLIVRRKGSAGPIVLRPVRPRREPRLSAAAGDLGVA